MKTLCTVSALGLALGLALAACGEKRSAPEAEPRPSAPTEPTPGAEPGAEPAPEPGVEPGAEPGAEAPAEREAEAPTEREAEAPAEREADPPAAEAAADTVGEPVAEAESTLVTEEVTYEGGGVTMKGYLVWDAAHPGPRPGVLVVHEWWGHNEYVRARARMLAELGYTALAVDMYGDGKTADHPKDAMQFAQEATKDVDAALARLEAGRALLAAHAEADGERVAAVGYCFGGAIVLNAARSGAELAGVVSFHGNLTARTPAEPGTVKAPILVLNGADDPMVPPEQVKAFEDEMTAAGATFEVVNYEGATHAFTNPEATARGEQFDLPLAYDAQADQASWDAMSAFLARVFAPGD